MSENENKQSGGAFEALLGELEIMTKALPAADEAIEGDKKIAAAAGDGDEDEDDELEGEGKPMAKSFKVTLADGTEVEAEDGTELVKSMIERVEGNEETMAKALGSAVNLIKAQGVQIASAVALVKSLQSKVAELSSEGRGRKTVVSVHEKPAPAELAKSDPQGMSGQEFMAKANAAFDGGKISGKDLTIIDVALRSNVALDNALISKVLS